MKINKNKILASFENGLYEKSKLWFTDADLNDLFCFDLESKDLESICTINEEEDNVHRLFSSLVMYKDEVILIPFAANNVCRVNIKNRTYQCCMIESPSTELYTDYTSESKFMSAFLCGDTIYMVGTTYPAIAEYNLITNSIKYHSEWVEELKLYFNESHEKALFRKACIHEGKIYAPCCRANVVVVFDVKTHEYSVVRVGPENANYACICLTKKGFFVASRHTADCFYMSIDLESWTKLSFSESEKLSHRGYRDIIVFDSGIYVIPANDAHIYCVDSNETMNTFLHVENNVHFDSYFIINNTLCFNSIESGTICCYDNKCSDFARNWNIFFPDNYKKRTKTYKAFFDVNYVTKALSEEYEGVLRDFFSYIESKIDQEKGKCKKNTGKKIYELMKE